MSRLQNGISIDNLGDVKLARRFDELEGKVQKKVARKAFRDGAKRIRDDARRFVPKDSGRLRRSIVVRALRRSRSRIGVMVLTGARDKLGIRPGATGYYPAAIEFGYRQHGRTYPARPFLRRAADVNEARVLSAIRRSINEAIEAALR